MSSVPEGFYSDGCSSAPDSIFGNDLSWACRIHDWEYCTRSHPAGSRTAPRRKTADKQLGTDVRGSLPFGLRWIGFVYWRAVARIAYNKWDSCGWDAGQLCRHDIPRPGWMTQPAITEAPYGGN